MADNQLNNIEEAIKDFRNGKFVIVVDDEDRENEGDLIIAAEKITAEDVNFMLKNARGVLCAPITLSRAEELDLPHQVADNTSMLGTPFTITVDKLEDVPRVCRHTTALRPYAPLPIPVPHRRLSAVPDTSIPSMRKTTVCCAARDTLKPPLTCASWLGSTPPAHSWRL